jgi:hypothetical protein
MTAEIAARPSPLTTLPVQVLYGKRRFRSARVRELSAQGLSLTLRSLTLPPGTHVQLELDGPVRLLDAVVVRSTATEVTLRFREPQPGLVQGLTESARGREAEQSVDPLCYPPDRSRRPPLARHAS